jgi:hypothetical protein
MQGSRLPGHALGILYGLLRLAEAVMRYAAKLTEEECFVYSEIFGINHDFSRDVSTVEDVLWKML